MIKIYTDGSARANGKECGYGVAIFKDDELIETTSKQCENSTNNREELKAIMCALEKIERNALLDIWDIDNVIIYSDSAYCVNMYNEWIDNWERAGWIKYDKKPIENLDLVKILYDYKHILNVKIEKVKGHAKVQGNVIADLLATDQIEVVRRMFDK